MKNRLCDLLGIQYPIIAGGMVWCSGWQLASAVSNAGGLGLLGAGSMYPEVLREHIARCREATDRPFGVNVPLLYPDIDTLTQIIIEEQVPIVVTSAGSPKRFTPLLHKHGVKVMHVVSSTKFAVKCQEAGVDAVIAEGFEAGGHNGREETTTLALIPAVAQAIDLPLVAAGGIASGRSILAAQSLGAEGVQIGTLFALSEESSAHAAFKEACVKSDEGDTILTLKELAPTRLLKNDFYQQVATLQARGASADELRELLGRARAKRGIFEGDLEEGELEIGQVAAQIGQVQSVAQIFENLTAEYNAARAELLDMNWTNC